MQIAAVNERARRKYGEFVSAIDFVAEALESARHVIQLMDRKAPSGGWTVATKGELAGMRRRAFEELDALRVQAKKYEVELVSREWRL